MAFNEFPTKQNIGLSLSGTGRDVVRWPWTMGLMCQGPVRSAITPYASQIALAPPYPNGYISATGRVPEPERYGREILSPLSLDRLYLPCLD